jgi:hypothetical protein
MRLSLGFLLFQVLALLMLANAAKSFLAPTPPPGASKGSSPVATGVVSLLAAIGFSASAFYLFWF